LNKREEIDEDMIDRSAWTSYLKYYVSWRHWWLSTLASRMSSSSSSSSSSITTRQAARRYITLQQLSL